MLNNMKKTINILKNDIINLDNKFLTASKKKLPINKNLNLTENKKLDIKDENKNNIELVNNRIDSEICENTINKLTDTYLLNEYKECKSVKNEINKKELILNDYILDLIPAGTKGVIRGNKFNSIVKETINNLKLNNERFEICFEKQCQKCITSEIPDWYILEKLTDKVIIGMNQLDLWGGGHQSNRGSKYLINNKNNKNNTDKSKLLCVICNKIKFKSNKNKAYKLFEVGYTNDTLCYILNIESIINKFFN